MNRINILIFLFLICFNINGLASHKVYVLHGWGNPKTLMNKIHRDIIKAGFEAENYAYPGLYEDLDSIAKKLYMDIMKENLDSV